MKTILLISAILTLGGCKKDKWLGFAYPDKTNLLAHKIIGEYDSLDSCLKAVNLSVDTSGSYECAKNCDKSKSPMVCEETVGNEK